MVGSIPSLVLCGVISWSAAFVLARKCLPNFSFDFCNRLVSTIHAVVAVILATLSVEDWSSPVSPLASKPSPRQEIVLAVSLSYLIYDLFCCLFENRVSMDNAVHHLVSITGIGAGLIYGKCGSELVAALWVSEISSPFLHSRELLKEIGYKDTDLNFTADLAFAVTFSLARMVAGPHITYMTVSSDNPLIIKGMAIGLQLVSSFWFYKIVKMIRYKLAKRVSSSSKKVA